MTINADTPTKLASDLRTGDVVLIERIADVSLVEHTVCSVSRETFYDGTRIAVRYDNGACDFYPPSQRVLYEPER